MRFKREESKMTDVKEIKPDICKICGKIIPSNERATVYDGYFICFDCEEHRSISSNALDEEFVSKQTESVDSNQNIGPKGISGWLIIPAINFLCAPIYAILGLLLSIGMIQDFAPQLTNSPQMWLISIIDAAMIIATIVVAFFFFKKKKIAVRLIICLFSASIFVNLIEVPLISSIFNETSISSVARSCVFGAVWIPYFLKSKRVKNTFIE